MFNDSGFGFGDSSTLTVTRILEKLIVDCELSVVVGVENRLAKLHDAFGSHVLYVTVTGHSRRNLWSVVVLGVCAENWDDDSVTECKRA